VCLLPGQLWKLTVISDPETRVLDLEASVNGVK